MATDSSLSNHESILIYKMYLTTNNDVPLDEEYITGPFENPQSHIICLDLAQAAMDEEVNGINSGSARSESSFSDDLKCRLRLLKSRHP